MVPDFHNRKHKVITLRPYSSPSPNSTLSDGVLLHLSVTPTIQLMVLNFAALRE